MVTLYDVGVPPNKVFQSVLLCAKHLLYVHLYAGAFFGSPSIPANSGARAGAGDFQTWPRGGREALARGPGAFYSAAPLGERAMGRREAPRSELVL